MVTNETTCIVLKGFNLTREMCSGKNFTKMEKCEKLWTSSTRASLSYILNSWFPSAWPTILYINYARIVTILKKKKMLDNWSWKTVLNEVGDVKR